MAEHNLLIDGYYHTGDEAEPKAHAPKVQTPPKPPPAAKK